jgi:hypothetical protein
MRKIKYLLLLLIIVAVYDSCKKIVQLSTVPHIDFTNFVVFDTADILGNHSKGGRLRFHFEDGDGDVGLNPVGADQPDSTDLFLTLFRIKGGVRTPAPLNDPIYPSSYRIPYMERLGRNKILKGEISVTLLYLFYSPGDTISYDFYIMDRALNQSNIASTSNIVLSQNKIYK